MSRLGPVGSALASAAAVRTSLAVLRAWPPGGDAHWRLKNYAGRSVSRLGGPAYATGVLAVLPVTRAHRRIRAATALAVGAAAAVGTYDDLTGDASARGLRGHAEALAAGTVTTGAVKVAGLATGGVLAGALLRDNAGDALLAGALIAGCANLTNLFDLRPGRAIKVAAAAGLPAAIGPDASCTSAALGGAAALLSDDLHERVMLGDAGAGALGAAVGVGIAARARRPTLRRALVAVGACTVLSECVSFSGVIDRTPWLRVVDRWGRRV